MAERRLLRPERPDHVRAYDFVEDRTRDGRRFRMLCGVHELTRGALAIRVARKLGSADVVDALADLFILRGVLAHVRSDQGPEFVAEAVQGWIADGAPPRPSSGRRAPGRTAAWQASTASCATSCWPARRSPRSPGCKC